MNEEVLNQLLNHGLVRDAEYDACFSVTFLTTPFLAETGAEIELIYDESGEHVISIVGKEATCFPNGFDDQSALVRALWTVNKVNEEEIVEAERVGAWVLNTQSGNFLYTSSCPKYISLEALVEFCEAAIQTYLKTRKHFTNFI